MSRITWYHIYRRDDVAECILDATKRKRSNNKDPGGTEIIQDEHVLLTRRGIRVYGLGCCYRYQLFDATH